MNIPWKIRFYSPDYKFDEFCGIEEIVKWVDMGIGHGKIVFGGGYVDLLLLKDRKLGYCLKLAVCDIW